MYVFSTATIFTYVLKMKRNICPFQNTDYQHSNFCEKKIKQAKLQWPPLSTCVHITRKKINTTFSPLWKKQTTPKQTNKMLPYLVKWSFPMQIHTYHKKIWCNCTFVPSQRETNKEQILMLLLTLLVCAHVCGWGEEAPRKLQKISGQKSLQYFRCYFGQNDDAIKTFWN